MPFTKVAPAGIGTEPGTSILIGDSLLHSTGIDIGSNTGIGVTIRKHGDATFTGIITASAFFGDGSGLEGVSSSGIGTPLSDDDTSDLNKVYYVNQELSIGSTVTVNHPSSAVASYTHYQDLVVTDDADFIVSDGDTFIPDVLGIRTSTSTISSASGGRIRAGTITNSGANGAPNFPNGLTGTAGTFTGNLNVGGVLTYEDVTNVDSVGLITARGGIRIGAGTTVGPVSGIVTYFGDGSQLTGISVDSTKIETGNTKVETIDTGSDGHIKVTTEGTERFRINSSGQTMIGTTTPTSNQAAQALTIALQNNGNTGITLRSGTGGGDLNEGSIFFSDATSGAGEYAGFLQYSHSNNYFRIGVNGAEKLRISSEGYLTKPDTPAFFATHTGNSASGSTGYITYNTGNAYYNNGNHFNVNGRFTAPVTGIYHFHFHCFVHNTATQQNVEVILRRFNSDGGGQTFLTRGFDNKVNGNYGPPVSMSWTGPLTATQYVQVYSANELHHANGYFFGGYLIG